MLMLLVILAIISSLLVCLCGYFYYRLVHDHSALKKSHEKEILLQTGMDEMEKQYRPVLEDTITGLPAWQLFEDRLNCMITESARSQLITGLLLVEITDFTLLNNALGKDVGNDLLKEIGARMRQVLRKVDTVSRYKEATFGVMATQLARPETAAIVAQRILHTLAQPFEYNQHEIFINPSIGIAIHPVDAADAASLLQAAQAALTIANESGHQLYHFYQEKNQVNSQRELLIHVNLKRDTIFQELAIYYQPIVDMQTSTVQCMDTMLCWQHTELGLIDPNELDFHVARQRKQNLFTEWLLKSACRQFVQWRDFGFTPVFLGVSISIRQLESTPFVYHLSQIMQSCNFKPEWLMLELKDTNTGLSFDVLEKAFNMLEYLGVNIAIRNVGTSAFSLSYLRRINIKYLMLEQGFIDDINTNKRTMAVVEGLQSLTESLSCQLVVQGIEADEQVAMLLNTGCSLIQGRLLGEPMQDRDVRMRMAP